MDWFIAGLIMGGFFTVAAIMMYEGGKYNAAREVGEGLDLAAKFHALKREAEATACNCSLIT